MLQRLRRGIQKVDRILHREPAVTPGDFDLRKLPYLVGKDDPVILDIGCNDGSHTLAFLKLFENAKVFAFEPDRRALQSFREKVNDDRAKLYEIAISDKDDVVDFHVSDGIPPGDHADLRPGGWDLSGSIKKPKKHLAMNPWCTFDETIQVKTKRLDTWCREEGITKIDLVWADVQGAEEDLIRGGLDSLNRTHFLYTEYSDDELYEGQINLRKIRKLLPDFKIVQRFDYDVLLENRRWTGK